MYAGPKFKTERHWPSNGRLAEIGNRWLVACGDWWNAKPCEMLDTRRAKMEWEIFDKPDNVSTLRLTTVGIDDETMITAGGTDIDSGMERYRLDFTYKHF